MCIFFVNLHNVLLTNVNSAQTKIRRWLIKMQTEFSFKKQDHLITLTPQLNHWLKVSGTAPLDEVPSPHEAGSHISW